MRWTKLSFVALFAAQLMACGGEAPEVAPAIRPVRTHTVVASGAAQQRTFAGVARAGVESRLSFRVSGTVEDVPVELGDRVRKGQILARLDPTDYDLKVQEAEASLAQGEAGKRRAEADYDRVRALYENNNASKSELDAARAAAESAEAQVEASRRRLAQARQQLGYSVLHAPLAGAIADVDVEVNENVRSGQKIFLLTSGTHAEVEVGVPEVLIHRVAVGQPVTVTLDALPDRSLPATVAEVGVAATGTATTFAVTVRLDDPEPAVRSGMAAEAAFRFQEEGGTPRLMVPAVAVGEDREGRYVYVVAGDGAGEGTVRRRPVEIGGHGEMIEIVDGLEEGEVVVTAGVRRLSDGMRVKWEEGVEGAG